MALSEEKIDAKVRRKVIFNKLSGVGWTLLGVLSFFMGWQNSVALVWIASVYANVKTDLGAAEAADDRKVLKELAAIRAEQAALKDMLVRVLEQRKEGGPENDDSA